MARVRLEKPECRFGYPYTQLMRMMPLPLFHKLLDGPEYRYCDGCVIPHVDHMAHVPVSFIGAHHGPYVSRLAVLRFLGVMPDDREPAT